MTSQENQIQVKNDNISVDVQQHPGLRVALNITVTPRAVDAAYARAIKTINKEVSVPGFRKGKAPEEFILQHYERQVLKNLSGDLVNTAVREAIDLLPDFYPYRPNQISVKDAPRIVRHQEAKFVIEYDIMPKIPDIEVNELSLHLPERPPTSDEEINQILDKIKLQNATWEKITDRPVQEGDFVNIDIERVDEPQEVFCKDTLFEVSRMAPWMRRLVIGLSVNDSVEGMSERDPEIHKSESDFFEPALCRITINSIELPILPELDNDLLQRVGAPTLSVLKESIAAMLNQQATQKEHTDLERQLDRIIVKQYPFELPASVLEQAKQTRMEEIKEELKKSGMNEQAVNDFIEKNQDKIVIQVEEGYRLHELYVRFAQKHKFSVSNQDILFYLNQQAEQHPEAKQYLKSEAAQERMANKLLFNKIYDYLIKHVKKNECNECIEKH